jgi:hypothetical protein
MCKCIKEANKALAESNTALDTKMVFDAKAGKFATVIPVPTRKINSRGKRAVFLHANFCPLCGKKIVR